ncbi:MAG: tRNA lysidine(34) synthetase TilS [Candidatus Sulfotelmatobacter sp.]
MHELAERVLAHIRRRELLGPGDRVGAAVSGGIDSVALLRLLLELRGEIGIVVSVVHFDHKLRGAESEADLEFVAKLAREHGLEFFVESGDVAAYASEEHVSLEAAARELRYGFFRRLLGSGEERESTSGAEALNNLADDCSAGSPAPPKSGPQGLKPAAAVKLQGTTEVVPFPNLSASSTLSSPAPPSATAANRLTVIATGHTLDDQAETVLMRVIRGTGVSGLGGIYERIVVEDGDGEACGEIIRPLLGFRRRELEDYLKETRQDWREDSTNADDKFTRNRVRQMVLPMIEREFNPAVAENLAELAAIARGEEDYWENEVSGWLGTVVQWSEPEWSRNAGGTSLVQIQLGAAELDAAGPRVAGALREGEDEQPEPVAMDASVDRRWLLGEPVAVQRRLVKAVGEYAEIPLEFKHVEEILRFAAESGSDGKKLSLPRGWTVLVEPEALVFLAPDPRREENAFRDASQDVARNIPQNVAHDYEYELRVPGRVRVPEIGTVIEALRVEALSSEALRGKAAEAAYNPEHLLDGELLRGPLRVRNWRAGDRFWPAHTKAPKKMKELLQELHVGQPEHGLWPVVVRGDEIVWARGFAVPAKFRAKAGSAGVLIRETQAGGEGV